MSNQIVISSGAKVRSLEGVLTGTAGIVNSVPLGGANGVATLDSNGKVPLSQLPASVVTYLGTWNAATNTPTLANGTGDVGDLYICNVQGTVNFGAGPITFAVGDWVIYNGSEWQKSAGQNGTVTSVSVTSTGNDAISITGSPITTAGSINIGFTGDNTQYVNGAGDLTTFPTLTGYVPYTGATTDVDLGVHVLNAQSLHVKGTAGAGHLGLKHQSTAATGSANESLIYANVDGDLAWQNDNLYLTTLSTHANTANRVYTFPDASGTIALTSNLSSYVPYTGATSNVDLGSHNLTTTGDLFAGSLTGGGIFAETNTGNEGYLFLKGNGTFGLLSIYNSIFANGYKYGFDVQGGTTGAAKRAYLDFGSLTNSTTRTYSFPDASGTLALTSDIPSLSGYVPYTGATSDVNLGYRSISASNINIDGYSFGDGGAINFKQFTSLSLAGTGYTSIGANSTNILTFGFNQGSLNLKGFKLDVAGLTTNVWRTYTMPNADGTIALTSDIPSLANYVTLTGSQTITGIKTFTNEQLFGNGITLTGGYITYTSGSFNLTLNTNILTANRNIFLQDGSGTLAFTSDIPSLSGYVQGSGTTNYLSKFTASGTIGNSLVYDNGTTVAIGSTAYSGGAKLITYQTSSNTAECGIISYTTAGAMAYLADVTTGDIFRGDSTIASVKSTKFRVTNTGAATLSSNIAIAGQALSSWGGTFGVMQSYYGSYFGGTSTGGTVIGNNNYYNGTSYIYVNTDYATQYQQGSGEHFWRTAASGTAGGTITFTERMRITNTGNVGIGTSSPSKQLVVNQTGTSGYFLSGEASGTEIAYWYYNASEIQFSSKASTRALTFLTSDTERMRITSGGYLKASNYGSYPYSGSPVFEFSQNASDNIFIWTNTHASQPSGVYMNYSAAPNGSSNFFLNFYDGAGATKRFSVKSNGGIENYSANNTNLSDMRVKKEITPLESYWDKFKAIEMVKFKYIDQTHDDFNIGVIAQQLEQVAPEFVDVDGFGNIPEDGIPLKSIYEADLHHATIKVLQEAMAKIEELEAKVTALENK